MRRTSPGEDPTPEELLHLKGESSTAVFGELLDQSGQAAVHHWAPSGEDRYGVEATLASGDVLVTGSDGRMEWHLAGSAIGSAFLRIEGNTALGVDSGSAGERGFAYLRLFSGQFSLTIQKLPGRSPILVELPQALLWTGGTVFSVLLSAQGEGLIVCRDGGVLVLSPQGRFWAKPGWAVSLDRRGGQRTFALPSSSIASVQRRWIEIAAEEFPRIAPEVFGEWWERYSNRSAAFAALLRELGVGFPPREDLFPALGRAARLLARDFHWLSAGGKSLGDDIGNLSFRPGLRVSDALVRLALDRSAWGEALIRFGKKH